MLLFMARSVLLKSATNGPAKQLRNFTLSQGNFTRFVQFQSKNGGPQRLGAQICFNGDIIDISAVDSSIPNSLVKFLKAGPTALEKAKRIIAAGKSTVNPKEVKFLAPITKPDKVACVGLNYAGHCEEQNIKPPKEPMFFSKFSSTIIGPFDEVKIPPITNSVDWEVELAVVIGKQGKAIPLDKAMDHVFGYTIAQDISSRDWQIRRNGRQFLLGKSMDTFCPLGPCVVTKECLNPDDLKISCTVNNSLKQCGNTSELLFKVDFLVSYLSQIMTLFPGDIILTGTPAGVGYFAKPQEFLKPGDTIESEIEGIGKLITTVA